MNELSRKKVKEVIDSNKRAIKNPAPKKALETYPDILKRDVVASKIGIEYKIIILEKRLNELLPYIKNIKKYIKDITEETFLCAVYLLMSNVSQNWNSLISLAKEGDYGSFAFVRLIKEGIALSDLLVLDFQKNKRKNLEKWFSGEILGHSPTRTAHNEFMKENGTEEEYKFVEEANSTMYFIESQNIHSGYAAMLERISPYTKDFDYSGRTQYHRTNCGLDYALGAIDAMNISLKFVYADLLKDMNGFKQLDDILIKYSRYRQTRHH